MENLTNTTPKFAMTEEEINSHKIGSGKHNGMNCHYYDSEEAAIAKRETLKSGWKKGYGTIYGPFVNGERVTYWEVTGFNEVPANDFVRDVVGSGRPTQTSASQRSQNNTQ
jgi:hypothetical protein